MANYKIQEIIDNGTYVKMPFVSSTGASPTFSAITATDGFVGDGSGLTNITATWDGLEVVTVGEDVINGNLLYLNTDGKYWKVSNTAEASSSTELRMATATILTDASGSVVVQGRYTTTGLVSGTTYWVGTAGNIQSTQPTGDGEIVRYIGTALNETELEFNPDGLYVEISNTSGPGTQPGLRNVTTSQTIITDDFTLNVTSNGATTQTLPTAVAVIGKIYNIKNSGTGTVTIVTTSSQTIDGALTAVISNQYQSITVQSNGTNWIII